MVSLEYSDNLVTYIGYCESAEGLGFLLGPVIGQVFYTLFGFDGAFYAISSILFVAFVLCCIFIPGSRKQAIVPKNPSPGKVK